MTPIKLALDWIPNPVHSGIFVAFEKGWYKEAGISLEIISPDSYDFKKNPYSMAQAKEVDLAINPSECAIINHQLDFSDPIVAVAAILQGFPTAITKNNAFPSETFQYGSFGIPFEQTIVQRLMDSAFPNGKFTMTQPEKMEIYDSLAHGGVNISWLFKSIEGVEADHHGRDYSYFSLEENGIPYGYSPVMFVHPAILCEKEEILKKFMQVTALGYVFAKDNAEEACRILLKYTKTESFTNPELLLKMQLETATYYLNDTSEWGKMTMTRWANFLDWLEKNGAITPNKILSKAVFTNQLFWKS